MLLQVTIENFLSFRDATTFSMLGANSDLSHAEHLAVDAAGKGKSLLPVAAIYGANAAGKSNLIKAIHFAKDLIVEGTRSRQTINIPTFKLGDYSKKPSKFEFVFTHKKSLYSYGFILNSSQILEEWLYGIPADKKREVCYFNRNTSGQRETTIEYGRILLGKAGKERQFLDFVTKGTRPNQLFLTESVERNISSLMPIVNWFSEVLTIISAESHCLGLEMSIQSSEELANLLSRFLKFSGTGIDSIGVDEVSLDFDRHFPNMPSDVRAEINEKFNDGESDSLLMIRSSLNERYILIKREQDQISLMRLKINHLNDSGQIVEFSIEEESEGTQRLINLIPALFMLKYSSEKVILLDEIDRRLHPLLSRRFLEFCLQENTTGDRNQLIFTTHDTNLLDLDLMRRDEIWFVEKSLQGSSSLYSLAEFKIRPDLKVDKGYLNGRFGAIPFFGDVDKLGWLEPLPINDELVKL
jgi:uncharacterized protein